jgi:hypothetical protein
VSVRGVDIPEGLLGSSLSSDCEVRLDQLVKDKINFLSQALDLEIALCLYLVDLLVEPKVVFLKRKYDVLEIKGCFVV